MQRKPAKPKKANAEKKPLPKKKVKLYSMKEKGRVLDPSFIEEDEKL